MTIIEAIEAEIEREQREWRELFDRAALLAGMIMGSDTTHEEQARHGDELWELLLAKRFRLFDHEIAGKRQMIEEARRNPFNPMKAIDDEYEVEWQRAQGLGQIIVRIRERMIKERMAGMPPNEAEQVKLEHAERDLEIEQARLRGKSAARAAAHAALEGD